MYIYLMILFVIHWLYMYLYEINSYYIFIYW